MKRSFAMALALTSAVMSASQNLVPNGSFEEYTTCPDYWNQLGGNVADWEVCSPSPDFFHTCRDSSDFGVPSNWRGYQHAAHGQGYSGVITYQYNAPDYREFICAQLSEPLTPGQTVVLSMKVALGGFGSYWLYSPKWTCKGLGMRLSTEPFVWSSGSAYPNAAQLYMETVLVDTTDWVLMSASYVADSSYQYVVLGNFFEDSLSTPTLLDTVFGNQNVAYVYIDEVCVAPMGMACDFADLVSAPIPFQWSINSPFQDRLEIKFVQPLQRTIELFLCDADGRPARCHTALAGTTRLTWAVNDLASGLYVLCSTEEQMLKPIRALHVSP